MSDLEPADIWLAHALARSDEADVAKQEGEAAQASWRETGYRAELVAGSTNTGCQAGYESQPHFTSEPNTFRFAFGERFSASGLLEFPKYDMSN